WSVVGASAAITALGVAWRGLDDAGAAPDIELAIAPPKLDGLSPPPDTTLQNEEEPSSEFEPELEEPAELTAQEGEGLEEGADEGTPAVVSLGAGRADDQRAATLEKRGTGKAPQRTPSRLPNE